jgi:hypothetical protein
MGIWFRAFFVGILGVALSGCILQSKLPLFGDAQAKMLLAKYANLMAYEKSGQDWIKSKDQIVFSVQARHYLAKADKSEMVVRFVPITNDWWVLQAVETDEPASYVLVEAQANELLLYPITCKALQISGNFDKYVKFVDTDCFIKFGADYKALFKLLSESPGESTTKLVSEP